MIPKIIHYCWFGGNELPELAQKDGMKAILILNAVTLLKKLMI